MEYNEGGGRKKTLKQTLQQIANVYGLARIEGIQSVRFLNTPRGRKNVTSTAVGPTLDNHNYGGVTRIGNELKKKILDKFISAEMGRPLLVIVITDGSVRSQKNHI